MKLEEVRSAGVFESFLKTSVPVWPGCIKDESAEIESQGVRGWPDEPMIDGTIE